LSKRINSDNKYIIDITVVVLSTTTEKSIKKDKIEKENTDKTDKSKSVYKEIPNTYDIKKDVKLNKELQNKYSLPEFTNHLDIKKSILVKFTKDKMFDQKNKKLVNLDDTTKKIFGCQNNELDVVDIDKFIYTYVTGKN
jgi:hypothetical protein